MSDTVVNTSVITADKLPRNTEIKHFDVVISGGGLSGSLMALSLSSLKKTDGSPITIAIVEAHSLHQDDSNQSREQLNNPSLFDDRVLALSHASVDYLKSLNVWPSLSRYAQPINDIHISDRGYYGKARINAKTHNVSALGYVIEMSKIGAALHQTLAEHQQTSNNKNMTWFCPDVIESITWHRDSVNIVLGSSVVLTASLLIGCDGAQSICRKSANIAVEEEAYEQSALITNVATQLPHNNIAYERFTEHGPIAMLPLVKLPSESSRCSLVWTLTPEQADKIKNISDDAFKRELETSFGRWLGEITQVGKRDIYPLSLVRAQEQMHHRMVLIGNASHTIHPIAGQGFNLGLRDVQALSSRVAQSLAQSSDIGSMAALSEYAQQRKKDHDHIITLTDSLVTLFSNQLPPLVAGRNIALKVLNYVPTIKNAFVNKTMGY